MLWPNAEIFGVSVGGFLTSPPTQYKSYNAYRRRTCKCKLDEEIETEYELLVLFSRLLRHSSVTLLTQLHAPTPFYCNWLHAMSPQQTTSMVVKKCTDPIIEQGVQRKKVTKWLYMTCSALMHSKSHQIETNQVATGRRRL